MKRCAVVLVLCFLAAAAFGQDFKQGEVLSAAGQSAAEQTFHVAKVLKAASDQTKNQAQVLYVSDGAREWVDFVVPSHPARKGDVVEGAIVFYPSGWAEYDTMTVNDYRSAGWRIGHVTSLDEMFKNLVEVDGEKYFWKFLRIPEDPRALEESGE